MLRQARAETSELTQMVMGANTNIAAVQRKADTDRYRIMDLEKQVKLSEKQNKELENKIAELENKITDFENKITELDLNFLAFFWTCMRGNLSQVV